MKSVLHNTFRSHGVWIVLFLLCLGLQLSGLANSFRFDRKLIEQGEFWLLISAHLVHLNWNHFLLNMAGLLLVAIFFNRYCSQRQWLLLFLFSAAFSGLGIFWLNPNLVWYVGMSGVLHGLFVVGAWNESRRYALSGWALLLLILAKLIYEQMVGAMPGSESMTGGRVAVNAHLYGAVSGVVFVFVRLLLVLQRNRLLHQVVHVDDGHQNSQDDSQHHGPHHND